MKARIKLQLTQNAMRSSARRERRILQDLDRRAEASVRRVDEQPIELKRRIAATIHVYKNNWSPARVATEFGWELDDVEAWVNAGTPLL